MTHAATNKRMRVMLVDDHPIVRQGIAAVIGDEDDIEVVGQAGSLEEALSLYPLVSPDVTLVDLRMPGGGGIELMRLLKNLGLAGRFVVLTSFDDDRSVERSVIAGARGFLLKGAAVSEILETIRAVHAGQKRVPVEILERLRNGPAAFELSKREREVLICLAKGQSNKEIARSLQIAEETVKTHVVHLLTKLGVPHRVAAATYAIKSGLLDE